MELDAQDVDSNLHPGFPNVDIDHELEFPVQQDYKPMTPQRPDYSHQALNPEAHNFYPSPPSSIQVNGNTYHTSMGLGDSIPFATLPEGGVQAGPPYWPRPYADNASLLTPNSATTSQVDAARRCSTTGSPIPGMFDHLVTSPRLYSHVAQFAPARHRNGSAAPVPARENIPQWAASSNFMRNSGQSLLPVGNRTRAASVASSIGHGDFVCEGGQGKTCGKRFPTRSKMTHHARCHKEARKFCTLCDAGFYYEKDLKRHMKTHLPRDKHLVCNNICCPYRDKPFARKDHLERHSRSCQHSQA